MLLSCARCVKPKMGPVVYPFCETMCIWVASKGVRRISAKNLFKVTCQNILRLTVKNRKLLCDTGGTQVDGGSVFGSSLLVACNLDKLLLPVLITSKLCSSLYKVTHRGGPKSSEKRGRTFPRDNIAPAGEERFARKRRIYLYACFNDIESCKITNALSMASE
jgi:hypothetical protein